jgi:hypothetical protein
MNEPSEGLQHRAKKKGILTVRKSLSSRGGYRGGCGAKEGEDLVRRTPSFPHRLLPRSGAWERTKVMDGRIGSGERMYISPRLDVYNTMQEGRSERSVLRR